MRRGDRDVRWKRGVSGGRVWERLRTGRCVRIRS